MAMTALAWSARMLRDQGMPSGDPEERQRRPRASPGGHLNARPLPSIEPDRLTCGVRVLTVFPSPPRGVIGERTRSSITQSRSADKAPRRSQSATQLSFPFTGGQRGSEIRFGRFGLEYTTWPALCTAVCRY
jgi:hypothetical protein